MTPVLSLVHVLLGWAQANLKWPDMCLPHPYVYRLLRPSPGMDSRLLSLLLGGCLRHRTKRASSRIRTGTVSLDIHIRLVYFTPPHNTHFILFFHAQSTSYDQWMLNPQACLCFICLLSIFWPACTDPLNLKNDLIVGSRHIVCVTLHEF